MDIVNFNKKNILLSFMSLMVIFICLYGVYYFLDITAKKEFERKNQLRKTDEIILYWGVTCPHCKNVEDYLKEHPEIEKKIKIVRKEVFNDKKNAVDMEDKAYLCNFDTRQGLGVPFLYFKGECVEGDKSINSFLTEKTKD
jgi:glutaredoxin